MHWEKIEGSVAAICKLMEEGQDQPKIPQKRKKFQEIVKKGEGDGISELPDYLLLEILSRLPSTKEAIRTSTLSKRWKHLWTLVPILIFKHSDDPLIQCRQNPNSRSDFVSFVDKTLTQCRQLKLKKFEVFTSYRFTSYDIRFKSHLNNWIRYAISRNVEELNLEFWYTGREAAFLLDQVLFINSCITDMRLAGCKFNPTGAISWKNLKSLCIFHGKLDEELIENILSGSPQLETFVLDNCYGYKRLDITSTSVKNLVFTGYFDPTHEIDNNIMIRDNDYYDDDYVDDDLAKIIEIKAPNILSLTIKGNLWLSKLLLVNVYSLMEANLDYTFMGNWESTHEETEEEMLEELILNLFHVKELKIGSFCSKVVSRLEAKGFSFPSNLKFSGITDDWSDSDSDW